MCEANGKLTITSEDSRGYIRGRVGHQGFYIPAKGGARMSGIAKANEGEIVSATLVRGMLVRIHNGIRAERIETARTAVEHREYGRRIYGDSNLLNIGGYAWLCRNCGARIFSTDRPRFCTNCRR